jgi:integrase
VWTIPEDRMKMGKLHKIPLSSVAVEILTAIKVDQEVEPNDYVLASPRGRPLVENTILRTAKRIRPAIALTAHGFRSSFRDWAGDMTDTPREVTEAALARVIGGVEGAYRRSTALQKRRALIETWASHCIGGTVILFQRLAS